MRSIWQSPVSPKFLIEDLYMKVNLSVAATVAMALFGGCSCSPEPLPDQKTPPKSGEYRPFDAAESGFDKPKKEKNTKSP